MLYTRSMLGRERKGAREAKPCVSQEHLVLLLRSQNAMVSELPVTVIKYPDRNN